VFGGIGGGGGVYGLRVYACGWLVGERRRSRDEGKV